MTLRVIYHAEKNKPTPGQVFIQKLADATCREAATVRMWLSGVQTPNPKTKERISMVLNIPVEILFPEEEPEWRKEDEI